MGIPSFSNWIITKYPEIVGDMGEYYCYDNLYLDMSEIIYHVLHPTDRPSPVSRDQVFFDISNYIDGLYAMVRPRKLIYFAFDGVAPRAKMNEQRCRRFLSAKNTLDADAEEDRLRKKFEDEGKALPAKNNSKGTYFSHLVAPGTSFMADLSTYLKTYIISKLSYHWKDMKVVLSDANVPGEGEHKIMSFIRRQKNLPGYDKNGRHCVFGSDADLILLALATHEPQFSILRSVVVTEKKEEGSGYERRITRDAKSRRYQLLHIFNLRKCLRDDLRIPKSNIEMDNFERRVDDFVCICLFLGNDFLPGILSLNIWEGAIDLLLTIYKSQMVNCNIYLTEGSTPNLKNIEKLMAAIGTKEDNIFKSRVAEFKRKVDDFKFKNIDIFSSNSSQCNEEEEEEEKLKYQKSTNMNRNMMNMRKTLKEIIHRKTDTFTSECKLDADKVKLGESGWKERFYKEKFLATGEKIDAVKKDVILKYIEGICWIMKYYYEGVISWKWYYPYYYAPFASDFQNLGDCKVSFELGRPFKPYTHMLATSPAINSTCLPLEYRKLIINSDSPIKDFYPKEFEIDMDGKRYNWQGIVKLPFVDEDRLLSAVTKIEDTLTVDQVLLNNTTTEIVFISSPATQFSRRACNNYNYYGWSNFINRLPYYIY